MNEEAPSGPNPELEFCKLKAKKGYTTETLNLLLYEFIKSKNLSGELSGAEKIAQEKGVRIMDLKEILVKPRRLSVHELHKLLMHHNTHRVSESVYILYSFAHADYVLALFLALLLAHELFGILGWELE